MMNADNTVHPPLRFVTAASLFDGHDASINIMRRILQSAGAEVIHLAHNRSVAEVVDAAIQEDVQGIAISSYQGGHVEYFKYVVDMLKELGADHIRVFGGGGGVIVPAEIKLLHDYGVARVYSPQDGQQLGLQGMIDDMLERCSHTVSDKGEGALEQLCRESGRRDYRVLARSLSAIENGRVPESHLQQLRRDASKLEATVPIMGITGTGGAGKSSLTDEIIRRFRLDSGDTLNIGILAIDPTRKKTGGALLGDRIRMNAIYSKNIYLRSIGTRSAHGEVPAYLGDIVAAMRLSGFDLIIIETPGIGQGDAGIVPFVDCSVYVMTPEFGAQSQLEKIDMLDFADLVIINKFDRKGSDDAYHDVCKQVQRNRQAFAAAPESMPVFGTVASHFNDDGVTAAYQALLGLLREKGLRQHKSRLTPATVRTSSEKSVIVPPQRQRYLNEVAETVREYHARVARQSLLARERQQLSESKRMLQEAGSDAAGLDELIEERSRQMAADALSLLESWPAVKASYEGDALVSMAGGREIKTPLNSTSLAGSKIPRVALPKYQDHGELLQWLMKENLPGKFPFTAGVFPFKREGEEPARMFAGEGDAFRTNRRFKHLSAHTTAKRLSTAFDSVTLYGFDPDERPDIYGKIGNAGVSIATLDDMKALYDGFDLCDPMTSVSMTINGPAPTILAMFLNTAIDQQVDKFRSEQNREPDAAEYDEIRANSLRQVRGTVQADILKEDQGQNTCIFSTEFSLRMMGDIEQYFIDHQVRNFYSVSISGYHIAEAGANPITQLAFTLANGFTYVETYLARGMNIDDFAPNLSFFFSNGMDPEYTVMGRVARRIWATTLRDKYGASERSQKLKYHIQTSGRSLHAQEMNFNDIRTTLQALIAIYDNCNSLHTNAYDEAITTPTEGSVRRAMAIQLIINREFGLAKNENPNQGCFIIDELTDLVEEAVLCEFERISERGGVLGAMETGYQRSKIQEESLYYEQKKHDGSLPVIGVNTFLGSAEEQAREVELARSTEEEKQRQIARLRDFQQRNAGPAEASLERVQYAVTHGENGFAALMEAVRHCSLGQITRALFEVGGQYRRSM